LSTESCGTWITAYIAHHNKNPKPFIWAKSGDVPRLVGG